MAIVKPTTNNLLCLRSGSENVFSQDCVATDQKENND